jgi:hypothetical protein
MSSAPLLLIGVAAGSVSALLYAAAASGSPLALMLLYVAPLPILIAGVGWRHHAGLVGAGFGMVALALAIGPRTGLYFALAVGLPAWWLAYLALLARPGDTEADTEWYPVGRLVAWTAGLGALLVAATVPLVASSLEEYRAALRDVFSKALLGAVPGVEPPKLPGGQDPKALIDLMAVVAPGLAATVWTLSSLVNLWLAGRICRASGRLTRPWPDVAAMDLPRGAALILAAGFLGSFLPGLPSLVAELFAATFTLAFALLGLAVMHVATRRVPARGLILFGLYAMLTLQPWIAVFLAGVGLAEQLFGVRRRFGPPPGGSPPTATAPLP